MENNALARLRRNVEELLAAFGAVSVREKQLSDALAKSREQIESLRADVRRYEAEKNRTRKKLDALLKRFDALPVDWEQPSP